MGAGTSMPAIWALGNIAGDSPECHNFVLDQVRLSIDFTHQRYLKLCALFVRKHLKRLPWNKMSFFLCKVINLCHNFCHVSIKKNV